MGCSIMLAVLFLVAAADTPGIVQTDIIQPPKLRNAAKVLSYEDYPDAALREGAAGVVSVALRVSSEGNATSCAITETSGYEVLDKTTCQLMLRRARFDPARDAHGAPVSGDFHAATSWGVGATFPTTNVKLDLNVNQLPASYRGPVKATVLFGETGRVIACDVSDSSGDASADQAVCAYATRQLALAAPRAVGDLVPAVAVRYVIASLHLQQPPRHD
ncbi:hypothetical protein AQZ49_15495 [Novosphingobium sp. FSW06-99]|nr:hypothetical protein AQZ49_15495 [Novosphingobium sp. FSW06-99]